MDTFLLICSFLIRSLHCVNFVDNSHSHPLFLADSDKFVGRGDTKPRV